MPPPTSPGFYPQSANLHTPTASASVDAPRSTQGGRRGNEIAYRLIVEEVPPVSKSGVVVLRTILRIAIPIFVAPQGPPKTQLLWKAEALSSGQVKISVANPGNMHVQVKRLVLSQPASPAAPVSRHVMEYLLPGKTRAPGITAQATAGRRLGRSISLAVGYLRRQGRTHIGVPNDPSLVDISVITSSLNWRLGKRVTLISAVNYSPGASTWTTASFNLIIPLGSRDLAMVSNTTNRNTRTATVDYSHGMAAGPGIGYRFRGDAADNRGFDVGFYAQNSLGSSVAEISQGASGSSVRLGETSSIVLFHGKVIPTRWLSDSFAIVEVPQSGIKVLANNQYFGTIGRRGFVLLPSMAAYSPNAVRLDDQSVPIDLQINLEERRVVPMPRSGVYVKFVASKNTGALLILVTKDGTPVPLGASVFANGSANSDTVAMRGEVFVQNITLPGRVSARWNKGQCDADVPAPPGNEPLPRIGPLACQATQ